MKLIIDIDEDYVKIINKNGASNYPEEIIKNGTPVDDVFDKIRAEITEYKDDMIIHAERNEMIDIVLGIIDKYRNEVSE